MKTLLLIVLGLIVLANPFSIDSNPLDRDSMQLKEIHDPLSKKLNAVNALENITNYEFISVQDMSRWNHCNKTFQVFNDLKLTYNATWKINDSLIFSIINAKPTYYCNDSQQNTEMVGTDVTVTEKSYVDMDLTFDWIIKDQTSTRRGIGTAQSSSDQILYAALFEEEEELWEGFFTSDLLDYIDVEFESFTKIAIQPQVSFDEKSSLTQLLNYAATVPSIRQKIEQDLIKGYRQILNSSIHNSHSLTPNNKYYTYEFQTSNGTEFFHVVKIPTFFKFYNKLGINVGYINSIEGLTNQCFKLIETPQLLPTQTYGGKQQFISYQFYKNFLAYFIQQGYIQTVLNKQNWGTKDFNFDAFQLYDIFTNMNTTFKPDDKLVGKCRAEDNININVYKSRDSFFNVLFNIPCNFQINKQKVFDINFQMTLEVFGVPKNDTIDFWIYGVSNIIEVNDSYGFKQITQGDLGAIVNDVGERLCQKKIYGSGWKLAVPQKQPIFTASQTGIYITDLDLKPK